MAYGNFPNDGFFIQVTADDEATPLAQITVDAVLELSHIVVHAQKVGTHTDEALTLELHNQEYVDTPIFTSDTYSYTDLDIGSSHWAGTITFDFDRVPLNPNISYWVKVRASNYNYTDDSQYICFQIDWPEPINTPATPQFPGAALGIYGYENV